MKQEIKRQVYSLTKGYLHLKGTGLHHCYVQSCDFYYDGRSAARAYRPLPSIGGIDMDVVHRRIAQREALAQAIKDEKKRIFAEKMKGAYPHG